MWLLVSEKFQYRTHAPQRGSHFGLDDRAGTGASEEGVAVNILALM